jgi:hypothetical protein
MPKSSNSSTLPEWARLAQRELGRYYLAINPGWKYVAYQQEQLIPAIEALERGDFNRLMIFLPAGHSKTEIATKAFIPWYFGQRRNAGKNVILIARAADLALRFGKHIRDLMTRNQVHQQIFPHLEVDKTSHAAGYFKTNQGQEFMAFGTDGGISGSRADLIVMEDWIGNPQEANSEDVQHHLYDDIYKAVVRDRLRPGGKLLFITTRWGTRDVTARILDDEAERWMVFVIKAQEHREGCPDDASCTCPYLWESHFGRAFYDEFKADRPLWEAKWQQSPKPIQNQGFKEEWLRFYLPQEAKSQFREDPNGGPPTLVAAPVNFARLVKFNCYILVDPAMGKTAAHDRTAIIVMCAGPEGRLFLVDAVLDRLDPGERIDHLIRLCRLWKPRGIYMEEYAIASDSYFLEKALQAQGLAQLPGQDSGGAVVVSVGRKAGHYSGGRLAKADRIMQLVPDFRDSRVWLPKRLIRKLSDGTDFDIISYFVNQEFLRYAGEGSVAHDDMLDCLSRIRDRDVYFEHTERENDDEDEEAGHEDRGSWESRY